jgi:hypothetical protein
LGSENEFPRFEFVVELDDAVPEIRLFEVERDIADSELEELVVF